ncbi:MAG: DUF3471 domain-containing protein [Acidobacteria bacterium]|nr:DUF3471 domain-containing protein [Acidobacteriota bacterium]
MRVCLSLLVGICSLQPGIAQAQATGKPQTPPATTTKPQAPLAERKEIKVPAKVLQTYVGEYSMAPGRILTVTLEDGYLWGQPTDQAKRQMFPESETAFFLKDLDAQVTFQKEKGKVVGMVMDQAGRPQRELKKVK